MRSINLNQLFSDLSARNGETEEIQKNLPPEGEATWSFLMARVSQRLKTLCNQNQQDTGNPQS